MGEGLVFPRFREQGVRDDCLERLLEAARAAPAEWSLPMWRWIVARSATAKKYLEGATSLQLPLSTAPVILICLADTLAWKSAPQYFHELVASHRITEEEGRESLRRLREYYSTSPEIAKRSALTNALVAVHRVVVGAAECGLSAYWVTEFDEAKIKNHFHVPDQFLVAALLPLGYREEAPVPAVSKPSSPTIIYREKFGEPV